MEWTTGVHPELILSVKVVSDKIKCSRMDRFVVGGFANSDPKRKFNLNLPSSKHFDGLAAVKHGEDELHINTLIEKAVKDREKNEGFHRSPVLCIDYNKSLNLSKSLQHFLSSHPFPLSQGPVNVCLEMLATKKSVDQVLARQNFLHPR